MFNKAEYNKKYQKEHPEKNRYWSSKWYYKNKEKIKEKKNNYSKAYYRQHREKKIKENSERYKIWQRNNPDKILVSRRKYAKKYPEKIRFWSRQRHYRKLNAEGIHTLEEWQILKKKWNYCCAICEVQEPFIKQHYQKLTEDHIIPLTKGGSNYISNIQPLCWSCNSKKNDKIIA